MEDNIKIYRKEIGYEIVDWIHLAPDRDKLQAFVGTKINHIFP
jgi:hypothetical protein